jgi:hypothetical protein
MRQESTIPSLTCTAPFHSEPLHGMRDFVFPCPCKLWMRVRYSLPVRYGLVCPLRSALVPVSPAWSERVA